MPNLLFSKGFSLKYGVVVDFITNDDIEISINYIIKCNIEKVYILKNLF